MNSFSPYLSRFYSLIIDSSALAVRPITWMTKQQEGLQLKEKEAFFRWKRKIGF